MFIAILFGTAISIAAVAGFFSIYGLANIYVATFWSVVIMGTVLEVGKLVAASALQRYWTDIGLLLKSYLIAAVVGLMIITSAGIFGYLSNAYQQDSVGLKDVQTKIELLKTEEQEISTREKEIDSDINRVGENYVRARIKLMESYKEEKKWISERRKAIRVEITELSSKQLEVEAHTGPIIYIARAFDQDVDTAIKWMTLLIIFVFDPLAIALTLMGNKALMLKNTDPPKREEPELLSTIPEPVAEQVTQPIQEPTVEQELDEPSPTIDDEEKLNELYKQSIPAAQPQPVNKVQSNPQPKFTAGEQSNFLKRMLTIKNNS